MHWTRSPKQFIVLYNNFTSNTIGILSLCLYYDYPPWSFSNWIYWCVTTLQSIEFDVVEASISVFPSPNVNTKGFRDWINSISINVYTYIVSSPISNFMIHYRFQKPMNNRPQLIYAHHSYCVFTKIDYYGTLMSSMSLIHTNDVPCRDNGEKKWQWGSSERMVTSTGYSTGWFTEFLFWLDE